MPAVNMGRDEFTEFPNPIENDDVPLFRPSGPDYRCTGCGGAIPGGMMVHADVVRRGDDLVVVGLYARAGTDGAVSHACGSFTDRFEQINGTAEANAAAQRRAVRERALRDARTEDDD